MFRRSNSQSTFGSLEVLLSPKKRAYLEAKHWSGAFRRKALPVLLRNEPVFAPLFCADRRPSRHWSRSSPPSRLHAHGPRAPVSSVASPRNSSLRTRAASRPAELVRGSACRRRPRDAAGQRLPRS